MPRSEIDDIFAASKTPATKQPAPSPSTSQEPEKKKKKNKKRKREAEEKTSAPSEPSPKRKVPETVVDPSLRLASTISKPTKPPKSRPSEVKEKSKASTEDEERFKDSRGTGPRRKTEEGFSIFKEDELGINDEGGDTPLCPFDCDCCF